MNAEDIYKELKKVAEQQLADNPKRESSACWYYDNGQAEARKRLGVSDDRDLLVEVQKLAYLDEKNYRDENGVMMGANPAWVVGATLGSKIAWMTPGFAEAKRYHDIYGS